MGAVAVAMARPLVVAVFGQLVCGLFIVAIATHFGVELAEWANNRMAGRWRGVGRSGLSIGAKHVANMATTAANFS